MQLKRNLVHLVLFCILASAPFDPGIYPVQPYRPGKVPVLLVHGTTSSPVWWAEMWNTLAELSLSPDEETIVRRMAVLKPLPEVKRVVFISTPHRGSYLAGGFARNLARRFLALPQHALQTTKELLTLAPRIGPDVRLAATSIDTMAPDNPAVLALAEIPVTPPIKAHSIIAVKGDDVPPEGGDGVVKYRSAHIAGVESELVVRSAHSCQSNPLTIEEVRRILLLHLAKTAR